MHNPLKDLAGAMFEDDGRDTPKPQPPHPAPQQQAAPAPVAPYVDPSTSVASVYTQPTAGAPVGDHDDDAYKRLFAKTDPATTHVFQVLDKYLKPIAGIAMDEKMKFKIALQQAQAQDGIQPDAVVAVFDQFLSALDAARQSFANAVATKSSQEVDARKTQAANLQTQIQNLQAQAKQLDDDAFAAQQKIAEAQHHFDVALSTRQNEISQEKAKYASLLA